MGKPLHLLLVDDSENDTILLVKTLQNGGYEVTFKKVDTPSEMQSELRSHNWDIITSDHKMPNFNASDALKLAKELRPDIPFIIVSGEIDLNLAVSLMRGGAKDYIKKTELKRLIPVIDRELHEVGIQNERQELYAALQESETRYRRLFETAQDGILILDADTGLVIDVNPFLISMLSYSKEEFLGKKLWELGAFKDKDASKLAYSELQGKGYIRYDNLPLQTKAGKHVAVEFVSNVYLVNDIRIAQCNVRDITEREIILNEQKRLQAEIIQARDFYLTLFENFPALIWRAGTDAKCNYFNKAWLEFTGRKLEEELGDGWAQGIHVDDYQNCFKVYLEAFNQQTPFEIEYRLRSANGRFRWVLNIAKPFYDLSGEFSGYIGICFDISQRKESEETITKQIITHRRDLSVLYQVAVIASELMNKNILLDKILTIIFEAIQCKAASIHLFDHDKVLCFETSKGILSDSKTILEKLPIPNEALEKIKKTLEPVLIKYVPVNAELMDFGAFKDNYSQYNNSEIQPYPSISYLGVPILVRDELIGIMSLFVNEKNTFTAEEIALCSTTARHIGLALKSIDLVQKEGLLVIENERAKLARDLHDSVTQSLYSLMLFSHAAQDAAKNLDMDKLDICLLRISEQSLMASKQLRLLLYELNLDYFEQDGLINAINYRLNAVERRLGIDAQLKTEIKYPIPTTIEWNLFFLVNEALTNALKHAQASQIQILIQSSLRNIQVKISDNGIGFNTKVTQDQGLGLKSMRDRAKILNGKLLIQSKFKQGTEVSIKVRR